MSSHTPRNIRVASLVRDRGAATAGFWRRSAPKTLNAHIMNMGAGALPHHLAANKVIVRATFGTDHTIAFRSVVVFRLADVHICSECSGRNIGNSLATTFGNGLVGRGLHWIITFRRFRDMGGSTRSYR